MPKFAIIGTFLIILLFLQIAHTQKVGVGLTNPSAQLHVKPAVGLIPMRVDNSNGIGILHVLNSQRVAIGTDANQGTFNVTGTTFLTDELTIRNATLVGNNILRFWKYQDNGVLDIYDGTSIINRINAKGISYFNGGFVGINITGPTARLDINGDLRVRNIPAGSTTSDQVLTTDANGNFRKVPVSALGGGGGAGDVTGVTAAGGLTGGGTSGDLVIAASANNGLNVDAAADKIQMGGSLVKATTIDHGVYTLTHNLTGSGDFQVADNGVMKFSVLDNGRVAVNGTNTAGQFNVTGDSYHSDDIYLRDGNVTGTNLLRLFDNGDEGVIDWYNAGSVQNRITAQGSSYINGGNLGVGTTNPSEKLHVQGNMRVTALAGSGNRMVVADANGAFSTQAIPSGGGSGTGDIDGVNAGAGVSGGGTTGTVTINALANNGLNVDAAADRIQLGGLLTEQTTIFQSNNDMNWDLTGTGDFRINDNGLTKFAVNDLGRVSIGSNAHNGDFNVTGQSYFSDDLYLRDGAVSGGDILARLYDSSDDGILDLYANNLVKTRLAANGTSYFAGGDLILRDGAVTSGDVLARLYASEDDGILDLYASNIVKTKLHGNGDSYFNAGNLSVGTTSGPGKFNVRGDSYFSNDLYLRDGEVSSGDILVRLYDSNDDGVIDLYANGSITNRLRGNGLSYFTEDLAIGTTSGLQAKLTVEGNSDDNWGTFIEHRTNNSGAAALYTRALSSSTTSTSNIISAKFETDNSTNSNSPHTLYGSWSEVGPGHAQRKVGVFARIYYDNTDVYNYSILADNEWINNLGTGVRYAAYFAGNVYTTGSYLPSHSSLKKNIESVSTSIDRLMKIGVKKYIYKEKGLRHMNLPKGTQTGFIAEELKEIFPELVTKAIQPANESCAGKEIEFEAVNYTGLVPHLVKGMQEQQAIIENFEKKEQAMIEDFEKKEAIQNKKIERLEKLVEQLLIERPSSGALNNN